MDNQHENNRLVKSFEKRWVWLGHVLRMNYDAIHHTALTWTAEGRKDRDRLRQTERERERERQRHRKRQTDRQTETERDRDRDRETDRETETETDRQRDRDRETDREREREWMNEWQLYLSTVVSSIKNYNCFSRKPLKVYIQIN